MTTINISADEAYAGVFQMINDLESYQPADILDDLEESQDHVGLNVEGDGQMGDTRASFDFEELKASVKEVSKGVSEKTAADSYEWYILFLLSFNEVNNSSQPDETMQQFCP